MEETKNDYESKKREREYAREEESKRVRMAKAKKSLLRYALWLIIVAIIGYGIFLLAQTAVPEGEDFSVAYDIQGRDHIADGEKRSVYNSNPPSSGPHYGSPGRGGVFGETLTEGTGNHKI